MFRVFTFLFLALAQIVRAGNPGTTVSIRGEVKAPTAPEARITLFNDPLRSAGETYLLSIQPDFRFSRDFSLSQAGFAELQYGDQQIALWLEPGQNLELAFTGTDFVASLSFSGSGAAANSFLKNFRAAFPELPQRIEAFMAEADAEEYKKFVLALSGERRRFVEADAFFKNASPDFQVLFSKNENYWAGYQLLRYPFDKPLFEGSWEPLRLPEAWFDFLQKMHISTSGLLQSPDYVPFLEKYLDYQKLRPENAALETAQLAEKLLKNEALWYFQGRDLATKIRAGKVEEAKSAITRFNTECRHTGLKNALENLVLESVALAVGMDAPNFGLPDLSGYTQSLESLRGKVVFLDFWASWCGHCVEEMPNLQRLAENFDPGEVAIVYVSLDKDPNVWKNFVQMRGLRGIHLWGESLGNSLVGKMYGVKALPASFLIDRKGKIVKTGSGGTSVEEISRLIGQILK